MTHQQDRPRAVAGDAAEVPPPAGSVGGPAALGGEDSGERARPAPTTRRATVPADLTRPRRTPATRPALAFGLTAVVAVVGLLLTWVVLVGTAEGQRLENAALRGAEFRSELEQQAAIDRLSQVSVTVFGLAILVCFIVGQLRKRGWLATVVVLSMAAGVASAELLKAVLARPALVDGPVWILRNSFPSGSAAVATAVGLGLYLVAPDRLRWLALTIGTAVAGIISEAVQTSGWHRLSDTIGATFIAIAALFAGLWVLARAGYVQRSDRGRIDPRVLGGLWLAAAVVLTFGTVVLVLLALFPVLTTPVDARRALLQTAFPLIGTGWTIVAILGASRVVEPFTLGTTGGPARRDPNPGE